MSSEKTIKMYKKFPFLPSLFKHYFTYSSDKKNNKNVQEISLSTEFI
jgi:hypothetical protein